MKCLATLLAVCAFVGLIGCNSEVPMIKVKGTVTLDGTRIEKGLVRFEAADGKSPSSKGGIIENGDFTAEVPPGEMTVRITSSKVTGKVPMYEADPNSPMREIVVEQVPDKYNVKSTLKETIKANNEPLEFKLVSK